MWISELGRGKLKSLFSFFNLQSAIGNLLSLKYFSLHQQWFLLFIALLLLGILALKFYYQPSPPSSEGFVKEVAVEVSGEVLNPGIYLFQNPPALREAIERAGGLKEKAQLDPLSSSTFLETGTLLTIEKESPQIPTLKGGHGGINHDEIKIRIGRMAANKLLVFSIPLDLNRVSIEDLCLIPGIGESLAQKIITYRERRRGFRSVEELKNVNGIGEKKYQSFKRYFII
jgi:competence ComEA-like helix-hairpin-helix protein